MSLLLNGIRASSVRLLTPWTGAWAADVELDLGGLPDLPTGPATLTIGTTPLVGTIDPVQSGRNGPRAKARVVAGNGGWEKTVASKHYHNDGGVLSTAVLATTAAEVLERVVETLPSRFGIDFVRAAGPASGVLSGLSWYVDTTGTTIVGPRPAKPANPVTVQILEWDARTKVATLGTDEVIAPGMLLSDTRFGAAKIRDVEQTWDDAGARATAWTVAVAATPKGTGGGELVAALAAIAKESAGSAFLPTFRFRVVSQGPDGRFFLQAVDKKAGVPDMKAISLAPAVPGMTVKVAPGTIAHVVFADGNRSQPMVVRFEGGPPAIEVAIGGALATGVATQLSQASMTAALASLCGALQAFLASPVIAALSAGTAPPAAAAAAALGIIAALPTNYSLQVKAV